MLQRFSTSSTLAALHTRAYRHYFAAQLVSVVGVWAQRVAQGWLVYDLTDSAFWLGVVAFAGGVPMLVVAPFAGVWADRWAKASVVTLAWAIEMLVALWLGWLTLSDAVAVVHLVGAAVALGITTALGEPARQALVTELAGRERTGSGLALNALLTNTAGVIGPALAGVLLVQVGAGWCFVLNGLSYLPILGVLRGTTLSPPKNSVSSGVSLAQVGVWADLSAGWRFVRHHPGMARAFGFAIVLSGLGINMVHTLLPVYAKEMAGVGAEGYAALNVALGVGSVVGSAVSVWAWRRVGMRRLTVVLALLLPLLGVSLTATTGWFPIIGLMTMVGLAYTIFFVTTNTLIQSEAAEGYRGRVMALWSMNRFGLAPLVALGIGSTAEVVGATATMQGCAFMSIVAVITMITPCGSAAETTATPPQ